MTTPQAFDQYQLFTDAPAATPGMCSVMASAWTAPQCCCAGSTSRQRGLSISAIWWW